MPRNPEDLRNPNIGSPKSGRLYAGLVALSELVASKHSLTISAKNPEDVVSHLEDIRKTFRRWPVSTEKVGIAPGASS